MKETLKRHHVFQYFFPPPDQLALGFADRSQCSVSDILTQLSRTPEVGHPFGELELLDTGLRLDEVVDALQGKGLLVEGDVGVEVTNQGKAIRAQVRFRPREGLLARLANIFSVKVDINIKDLFK